MLKYFAFVIVFNIVVLELIKACVFQKTDKHTRCPVHHRASQSYTAYFIIQPCKFERQAVVNTNILRCGGMDQKSYLSSSGLNGDKRYIYFYFLVWSELNVSRRSKPREMTQAIFFKQTAIKIKCKGRVFFPVWKYAAAQNIIM